MDNHFSILIGAMFGVLVGIYFPSFGAKYGIANQIFTKIMQMCVMPILITSVSLSLSKFILTKTQINIRKMTMMFLLFIFATGLIGIIAAEITNPGEQIDITASKLLHDAAIEGAQVTIGFSDPIEKAVERSLITFILNALPSNIFSSIATNKFFQVLIFSIILGIALAFISDSNRNVISNVLSSIRGVFESVFTAITYVLPIIIFLTLANNFGELGAETFLCMGKFVACMYFAFFLVFIINSIIISFVTKTSYFKSLNALHEPLTVAFVTNSGTAAIPSTINTLINKFQLNVGEVNLLTSISMILGQFGTILYFAFTAIFVAQFYAIDLGVTSYIFIILMSGVASLATIGSYESPILHIIGIILEPIGLPPITAFAVLLHAIDPIISPFRALILVQTNCALVSVLAKKK